MICQYSFGVTNIRWAQMFLPQRRKLRLLVMKVVELLAVLRVCKTAFVVFPIGTSDTL